MKGISEIAIMMCFVASEVSAQRHGLSIWQSRGWWGSNKNRQPVTAIRSPRPFPLVRFKRGIEESSDGKKMEQSVAISALPAYSTFLDTRSRNNKKNCIARLLCAMGVDGILYNYFSHNLINLLGVEEDDTSVLKNAFKLGMTHKSWMLCRNMYGSCNS
ncbi:uncharacterized protein LOC143247133 isoform X2 [Tachypleus tridentatus]